MKTLWKNYPKEIVFGILSLMTFSVSIQCIPLCLNYILNYVKYPEEDRTIGVTIVVAFVMYLLQVANVLLVSQSFFRTGKLGCDLRSAAMLLVYRKALSLSPSARNSATVGEIVTLMSVDSERIWNFVLNHPWIVAAPLTLGVTILMLCLKIGWPGLLALAAFVVITLFNGWIAGIIATKRRQMLKSTAERVKLQSELLQGVRVVKLYAWEQPLMDRVAQLRGKEVSALRRYLALMGCNSVFQLLTTALLAACVYIGIVYGTGEEMDSTTAYTILAHCNLLRQSSIMVPTCLRGFTDMMVSLKRLRTFMALPELSSDNLLTETDTAALPASAPAIRMRGASVAWAPAGEVITPLSASTVQSQKCCKSGSEGEKRMGKDAAPVLENVNVTIPKGSLTIIVGPTGSGKTTLLSSILGQLAITEGSVEVYGKVSYSGQESWVRNLSVRDNILFDSPYEENRYSACTSAAQLTHDFTQLPAGDLTEVGERGITLSGGQKARVAFARALYRSSDADVIVLDDPLSAVDMHVARGMFDDAIKGYLGGKTVLLTLNSHYQLLREAKQILVLGDRQVLMQGSYDELKSDPRFATFLAAEEAWSEAEGVSRVQSASSTLQLGRVSVGKPRSMVDINRLHSVGALTDSVRQPPRVSTARQSQPEEEYENIDIAGLERSDTIASKGGDFTDLTTEQIISLVREANRDIELQKGRTAQEDAATLALQREAAVEGDLDITFANLQEAAGLDNRSIVERSASKSLASPFKNSDSIVVTSTDAAPPQVETGAVPVKKPMGTQQESKEVGAIGLGVWMTYFGASVGGGKHTGVWVFLFMMIFYVALTLSRWWVDMIIGDWTEDVPVAEGGKSDKQWIETYLGWIGISFGCALLRELVMCFVASGSSKQLHNRSFTQVLRAPVPTFFDVTPLGRVINRFSKDLDQIDLLLPEFLNQLLLNVMQATMFLATCIIAVYWFGIVLVPLIVAFVYVQNYYRTSSRELKRLEALSRSPIFVSFEETLSGLSSIRAFGAVDRFLLNMEKLVDNNVRFFLTNQMLSRWIAVRLDMISCLASLSTAILIVCLRDEVDPTYAAIALNSVIQLTGMLQYTVKLYIDAENNMTAVERIAQYTTLPSEAPTSKGLPLLRPIADETAKYPVEDDGEPDCLAFTPTEEDYRRRNRELGLPINQHSSPVDSAWPTVGHVKFENVWLKYRPGLKWALKGLSFEAKPKEKIGICGRSGAGKSTILQALFRLAECNRGRVLIDGVDTRSIGLNTLRSRLAVIPQDPVLLSGTLRENLDPFNLYSSEQIWEALRLAHLAKEVRSMYHGSSDVAKSLAGRLAIQNEKHRVRAAKKAGEKGVVYEQPSEDDVILMQAVAERGDNFSVGQRQLICVARALLKKAKIILLDEATANVDTETDGLIQEGIRLGFADATVLTVAHRLDTIIHCDKILVVADGQVGEFAPPSELLARPSSLFRKLVDELGPETREQLLQIANESTRTRELREAEEERRLREVGSAFGQEEN